MTITSRLRGHLPIFGNKKIKEKFKEKRGSKGKKKIHEFYFQLELNQKSYFHAILALLEDFQIFDNFDHIFYLTFSSFSTPQIGYDPVGSKV